MVKTAPLWLNIDDDYILRGHRVITNDRVTDKQVKGKYDAVVAAPPVPKESAYNAISKAITKAKKSNAIAREIIQQNRAAEQYVKETLDVVARGYDARDAKKLNMTKDELKGAIADWKSRTGLSNAALKSESLYNKARAPAAGTEKQYFKKGTVPWNKIPGFKNSGIKSIKDEAYKKLVEAYNRDHAKPWRHAGTANQEAAQRRQMMSKKKAEAAQAKIDARVAKKAKIQAALKALGLKKKNK